MALVQDVDEAAFTEVLKGDNFVVCDFYAKWCGPCKMLAPKLEAMANEHKNIHFIKVDVDECQELVDTYRIEAMPTLVFFKNGQEFARVKGADEARIMELIQQNV
ncbi:hypothetical protein ACTXT7_007737 [Hymenolepis weldensis]